LSTPLSGSFYCVFTHLHLDLNKHSLLINNLYFQNHLEFLHKAKHLQFKGLHTLQWLSYYCMYPTTCSKQTLLMLARGIFKTTINWFTKVMHFHQSKHSFWVKTLCFQNHLKLLKKTKVSSEFNGPTTLRWLTSYHLTHATCSMTHWRWSNKTLLTNIPSGNFKIIHKTHATHRVLKGHIFYNSVPLPILKWLHVDWITKRRKVSNHHY
jgi:hypothetical protein